MEAVERIPEEVDRQNRRVATGSGDSGNNETLGMSAFRIVEGAEMPKPHVIPEYVRGNRTLPESVLNRLRRANQGLTQEWENPDQGTHQHFPWWKHRRLRKAFDSLQAREGEDPTRAEGTNALVGDSGAERPAPDREAKSPNYRDIENPAPVGKLGDLVTEREVVDLKGTRGRGKSHSPSERRRSAFSFLRAQEVPRHVGGPPGGGRKIQLSQAAESRFPQLARSEDNFATRRESVMGNTIKLVQANLQHAKAVVYIISRRFTNELPQGALIQEPWATGPG
ncbi:hypothetical protein JTB14_024076 [Gonioctena quinquepunctata]|nr:hypothetical protein JTB14_024076 [Gonioctena quinquepunctata]